VNIILFGPPGAGKGTQAQNLVKDYNFFKISTGDLLRNETFKKSDLGQRIKSIIDQGKFVSDDIINELIINILDEKIESNKLIFDGYPRNINQAIHLDNLIKTHGKKISCVISLKVDDHTIIKRITGRQMCTKCNLTFNKYFNPGSNKKHQCDPKFIQIRSDDTEETAKNRIKTYVKDTLPVLKHYKNQNLLYEIDGKSEISFIYQEICRIINSLET